MIGQASVLFDCWPANAEWFVVGGTADGNEAQTVHEQYPHVHCIGFEPNPDFVRYQRTNGFPGEVHEIALWSDQRRKQLWTPEGATDQSASVCLGLDRPDIRATKTAKMQEVQTRTLDDLSEEFGPFTNAVLWLDIEGAELTALEGATKILSSGNVLMVNFEAWAHIDLPAINRLLVRCGLMLYKVWNIGTVAGRDAQDYIYLLERPS